MPNWTNRVTKERAGDLAIGEAVGAAIQFQGRGSALSSATGATGCWAPRSST